MENNEVNKRWLEVMYKLEDIGIVEFEPTKAFGEMQMAIKPNIELCREWLKSRTINGKNYRKSKHYWLTDFYLCPLRHR